MNDAKPQCTTKPLVIMVQGTTSDAGKSVLVAGLCRWFARKGCRVAPFKPQNMALNSAVTACGGEIGRAQAVQAQAAMVEPSVHMNPVLLKPTSDRKAQVIVQGKALQDVDAMSYQNRKLNLMPYVLESFQYLAIHYDVIVIEGAGSPAEINLRENDIANMGFAEAADCPVIIVSDIDRGGVFAHLVGTLDLLSESEQQRTLGFVINKFRGDIRLLQSGLDWLEDRTQKKVYGVIPYIHGLHIEAEDAINTENAANPGETEQHAKIKVVVPVLPRISNHTDFDALRLHPAVELQFVGPNEGHPPADLIVLPGSKSVIQDLQWLKQQGWEKTLQRHLRFGGKVMGICGGFQMLGQLICVPSGIESDIQEATGLGLLPVKTTLKQNKVLTQVCGELFFGCDNLMTVKATGYEIHAGITEVLDNDFCQALLKTNQGVTDGLITECQQIIATYWHGIFDHQQAMVGLLHWIDAGIFNAADAGHVCTNSGMAFDYRALREQAFDQLCDVLDDSLALDALVTDIGAFEQQAQI